MWSGGQSFFLMPDRFLWKRLLLWGWYTGTPGALRALPSVSKAEIPYQEKPRGLRTAALQPPPSTQYPRVEVSCRCLLLFQPSEPWLRNFACGWRGENQVKKQIATNLFLKELVSFAREWLKFKPKGCFQEQYRWRGTWLA